MGNSFVLFDVSIVISHGQFHCGNRGHTQNTDFPWVKSHFLVGKGSSGASRAKTLGWRGGREQCRAKYGVCRKILDRAMKCVIVSVRCNNSPRF